MIILSKITEYEKTYTIMCTNNMYDMIHINNS